jgi:hypothetical protein
LDASVVYRKIMEGIKSDEEAFKRVPTQTQGKLINIGTFFLKITSGALSSIKVEKRVYRLIITKPSETD